MFPDATDGCADRVHHDDDTTPIIDLDADDSVIDLDPPVSPYAAAEQVLDAAA